jgi:hypothetical protein
VQVLQTQIANVSNRGNLLGLPRSKGQRKNTSEDRTIQPANRARSKSDAQGSQTKKKGQEAEQP